MKKNFKVAIFNYNRSYSKFIQQLKINFKNYTVIYHFKEKNFFEEKFILKKKLKKIDICVVCKSYAESFFLKEIEFLINNKIKLVQAVDNKEINKHGYITPKPLKSLSFEKIFFRKTLDIDKSKVKKFIFKKKILITGGAGSIGTGILRELIKYSPKEIAIIDNNEHAAFNLYNFNNKIFGKVKFFLCNIENKRLVKLCFEKFKPDIVFHAAAVKHLNYLEKNPIQGSLINIVGTENILSAAKSLKVKFFINISTDKAVNPTSVLGYTKRISEILCNNYFNNNKIKICSVRFGNVFRSRGSFTELVDNKINSNEKIDITSPLVERYFMSIDEAAKLILHSLCLLNENKGNNKKIYVFDMGLPVNIKDLTRKIIYLSGRNINKLINRNFTGLKNGEKLKETLFSKKETISNKYYNKIYEITQKKYSNFREKYLSLKKGISKNDEKKLIRSLKLF